MEHPSSHDFVGWIGEVIDPKEDLVSLLERTTVLNRLTVSVKQAIVRADLDVPIDGNRVVDLARLEALEHTLETLWGQSVVPVMLGHVGRDPSNTARPLKDALSSIYGCRVAFVSEWFADKSHGNLSEEFATALGCTSGRSLILLENTRKYEFETALWGKAVGDLKDLDLERLRRPAEALTRTSSVYISDAIASSNADWSSLVLPFFTEHRFLARSVANEFWDHIIPCIGANAIIFSGLKADKLDDLERITVSGRVKYVAVGGALSFPFLVAKGQVAPSASRELLSPRRVRQASAVIESLEQGGGTLVLPEDFIDNRGQVRSTIHGPSDFLDIGPRSTSRFHDTLLDFVAATPMVSIYMNGVLGKVEDPMFQTGTLSVFETLRAATAAGAETYVGGGDGAAALRRFGDEGWVSHVFTAGGTVLKAMSGRPISYLAGLALPKCGSN